MIKTIYPNNSVYYYDDCMNGMREIPDKFYDLAMVDPNYGKNVANMPYTQVTSHAVKQKNGKYLNVKKEKYQLSDWDLTPPKQEYFNELFRVSKSQIIFGIDYFGHIEGFGSGRIIWDKLVPTGLNFSRYENAYCSFFEDTVTIPLLWAGFMQAKSIDEPTVQQGNKKLNEKRIHPTQKPTFLYDILLRNYSKPNDHILDTHVGSGSSLISCIKNRRQFTGYEIDEQYYIKSNERLQCPA